MSETSATGTGLWSVIDRNARYKPRVHEALSGRQYALTSHEPTHMPRADAMPFLRDPAFGVFDEHGIEQMPLPASEAAGERTVLELEPNQCIARYDELSTQALLARVALRPGGRNLDPTSPREVLVQFLETAPTKMDERPENRIRDTGQDDRIDTSNAAFARLPDMATALQDVPVVRGRAPAAASAGFGA